jgi:zinc and cadmium transporter
MLALLRFPIGPWAGTFLSVAIVSGLPLLVTLVMARQDARLRRWLPQLTAFGAGAVFGAAAAHLIPEALRAGQPAWSVALGVLVGFAVFALIERLLAGHDHAHAHGVPLGAPSAHNSDSSEAECVHLHPTPPRSASAVRAKALAPMAFVGDAVHNFVDGALIAAGFLADPTVGVLTLVAVGLHELPREVGTFGLFVHSGIRPMRAVAYNAITAGVALVGAILTLLVGSQMANVTSLMLPFAAGTYLYIAQVVGRSALHDRHDDPTHWGRLAWSGGGAALMFAAALTG